MYLIFITAVLFLISADQLHAGVLANGGGPVSPFFDIAYRIAVAALSISSGRAAWDGLVERKITSFNTDILDWWSPSRQVFARDAAPVRYWIEVCMRTGSMAVCFIAAVIGWWQPNG